MSDTSRPPLQLALQRTPRDETTRLSSRNHYTLCLLLFVKGEGKRGTDDWQQGFPLHDYFPFESMAST